MLKRNSACLAASACACACLLPPLAAQTADWAPFPVRWPAEAVQSPADLSSLLDAPAGKHGFVRVQGGHFALPDGKRFRAWGVNITGAAAFPEPQHAPALAAHLARLGINCIRFHFLDVPSPRGLIAEGPDTRTLDPVPLDRLDLFISELKKRGIYANLNLNVGRRYREGDGVRDFEWLGVGKAATYFDPRLIELQKEYARSLLTHKNPHTGLEYRADPAVALVELVNENSLFESWISGRLKGAQTSRSSDVWSDIPPSYAALLTEQFNTWLSANRKPEALDRLRAEAAVPNGAPVPRLLPDQFASASKDRFQAEAAFYMDVERRYFDEMSRFLRQDLGLRVPIAGSSDHNHYRSGYPHTAGLASLDFVDGHVYWQHPKYLTDPKTGKRAGFWIGNSPMVDAPLESTVVQLARTAVSGKPYTVSEFDHPFPNEYAAEGIPLLAAYAAFQDWDALFVYTLAHAGIIDSKPVMAGHFDLAADPVQLPQVAAGALLFLRGDVRPAQRIVARSYSPEQVIESARLPHSERPYFTPGFPTALPLRHAIRIASFAGPPTDAFSDEAAAPLLSDTGQIAWHHGAERSGCVTIDTDNSQAVIGFPSGRPATRHLDASGVAPPFCAITLASLDAKPIARSARLLLTAGARIANTAMRWDDKRNSLASWGTEPVIIEPLSGTLLLRALDGATAVTAQALDGAGRPLAPPIAATKSAPGWSLPLGDHTTTWYVLAVTR